MLFSAFSTPAFALLNVPLIQKAVFSIDAPFMLSPALFVLVFALSPFLLALFRLFQSAPCLFSLFAFSRAHPLPRRPVRLPLFVNRAPASFLLSLLQGFPFSFYIPLICSVLACSSMQILFFSRINYTAAHPSPSLYTNALFPSPKQTLCAFSLVRLHSFCLVLTPCPVCAVCYARFGFPNGKRRPRFLPFLCKTKDKL